ncbi:MAG: RHS repeat-associated core domain-containing protein [Lentimicrobiaceae bacterium]|nr:RHS repeat-associated core domain-containing protein [Lentimicrobiaceae bacterium]
MKDHLGNTRATYAAAAPGLPQVMEYQHYYPFGMQLEALGYTSGADLKNNYLYNGKELQEDYNLNWYDYGARMYDPVIGRWSTIDPKTEKRSWVSPYNYCQSNPITRIDANGMLDDDIYYNKQGQEIYRVVNDKPDRNFVIKTSQTTNEIYPNKGEERGFSSPISKEAAAMTESEISKGNLKGDHMKNVIQIASPRTIGKMMEVVKDNGTGGTVATNNREYGGILNNGMVTSAKPGTAGNSASGKNASIVGDLDFHSHPSGTTKVAGGTASWVQPPSKTDINTATGKDYVFGMGNGTIYVYIRNGVIATIPMSIFKK